ncbi:MAG: hypothetical protein FWF56_06845 [Firmicutes bacterium]|nr:hypothetical protein [Bacillota bacterium]
MTKLENILEYQTIDIQKRRKLSEIENSECAKKAYRAREDYSKARQVLVDSEKQSTPLLVYFNTIKTQYEETINKFEELKKSLSDLDDPKELEQLIERLSHYRNKVFELEKKLFEQLKQSKEIIDNYLVAQQNGKKAQEIYKENWTELESIKSTNKVILENFDKQLQELRAKGDKELFDMYDQLTNEKKIPAFVSLAGIDTCSGCGIQMSQKSLANLGTMESICRCDTCRRIVFKQ